jgi:carboxypeptidase Q
MKRLFVLLLTLLVTKSVFAQTDTVRIAAYKSTANQLIQAATQDSAAYNRLALMCDKFGCRFSGTLALEKAIDWVVEQMKSDGLSVTTQDVLVPRWVRGEESCELVKPRPKKMQMLGLGGSIATPAKGITAEALVVDSFEELDEKAAQAKEKIVVFNVPFTEYGQTVRTRVFGAQRAAKVGAVASLIRSVTPFSMQTPHTGGMSYVDSIPKIPHAAITVEDAQLLSRMQSRGEKIVLKLKMSAKQLPDSKSRNVIAEIKGSEKPDEIVVFGGHIDSWDVGQGAMDDGGGCLATWQALKIISKLNLKPKRTLRLVLWTNEENGLRGGKAYAEKYGSQKHVLALESDEGTFRPQGFTFGGKDSLLVIIQQIGKLLEPIGASKVSRGPGGADISPLMESGVPMMSLRVDGSKYFWYHHTEADTPDKLDAGELAKCVAAVAVMVYVAADRP